MAGLTDDLERPVELRVRRSLTYRTDQIEDVERWRRAARIAGRRLGIPVGQLLNDRLDHKQWRDSRSRSDSLAAAAAQ